MVHPEVQWYAEVIERVGHAVRESAHYEQWYAEEQWQHLALTVEGHRRRHYESAAYGQHAAAQRTNGQSAFEYSLRRVLVLPAMLPL